MGTQKHGILKGKDVETWSDTERNRTDFSSTVIVFTLFKAFPGELQIKSNVYHNQVEIETINVQCSSSF